MTFSTTQPLSFIDFEGRLLALVPSRLRCLPRFEAILTAWGNELRELNDALYETMIGTQLANAEGDILRRYALVVGEPPEGVFEVDLKRLVRARITSNISDGGRQALVRVWSALTTEQSFVRDAYPASIYAQGEVPDYFDPVVAVRSGAIMRRALAAGIGADLVIAPAGAFTFGTVGSGPAAFNVAPLAQAL